MKPYIVLYGEGVEKRLADYFGGRTDLPQPTWVLPEITMGKLSSGWTTAMFVASFNVLCVGL